MKAKAIFKNEFDELRAGWLLLCYAALFSAISAGIFFAVISLEGTPDQFAAAAISLIASAAASYLVVKLLHKKTLAAIGLAFDMRGLRDAGIGMLAGILMMTFIFGLQYLQGYVTVSATEYDLSSGAQVFLVSMAFFCVAALFEEILFRGYPFQTLVRGIGFIPSTLLVALAFGAAHLANPNANAFGFINTAIASVLFCVAYWRTRSLWLPFGIHFGWNFAQTTLYGFPTSGVHFTRFELTQLKQFGPEWVTGGAYGPEAGVLATLAIVACGVYVYYAPHLRPQAVPPTLEHETETIKYPLPERNPAA